ncbi:MAG: hypothetical protein VKM34_09525 [Cyanobacteriota bacterium]|nr:hypothetical protein [Cyanobacteriota bacterium]
MYQEITVSRELEAIVTGATACQPRILTLANRSTPAVQFSMNFILLAAIEGKTLSRLNPNALPWKGRVPTHHPVHHQCPDLHAWSYWAKDLPVVWLARRLLL